MIPYMKQCDMTNMSYDFDIFTWLPNGCMPQNDSAFLYGSGSYLTGEFYANRTSLTNQGASTPVVANARKRMMLSFAKMDWHFEDLSRRFGAECSVEGACDGIVHELEARINSPEANTTSVLVLGRDYLKSDYMNRTFKNPLIMLTLNTPNFYFSTDSLYYTWDRIGFEDMTTNYSEADGLGLHGNSCSRVIDAYLTHQEANYYYIKDPLLPMYASAFFHLFQDAAVKEVELLSADEVSSLGLNEEFLGYTPMKGDLEEKLIVYSIPLASAVATTVGIVILLLYLVMMIKWPRDTVMLTDEQHFPALYAQVLSNDRYPPTLYERKVKLASGATVNMDDYVVDRISFYHPIKPMTKVEL